MSSDANYARMKQVTKTAVKKFGPFLLTGLAAVAEHHWLKKDDDDERNEEAHSSRSLSREKKRDRDQPCERDGGSEVRELREEVAKLREGLKREDRERIADVNVDRGEERQTTREPGSPRPPSLGRDPRALHDENIPHEEAFVRMPFAPTPPLSFPAPFEPFSAPRGPIRRPPQLYDPPGLSSSSSSSSSSSAGNSQSRIRDREFRHSRSKPRSRRRRRHHRHIAIPRRIPHHPRMPHIPSNATDDIIQAGKVAAVAGIVEALHVDDAKGEWIGQKGLRVGTSAAASFGATYGRERLRDEGRYGMKEVVLDVGTGVLVSGLVFGRVGDTDKEDEGKGRPGGSGKRRWSHYL